MSSIDYLDEHLALANLRLEKGCDTLCEYRQSKLAGLLFAFKLQRRIAATHGRVLLMAAQLGANWGLR